MKKFIFILWGLILFPNCIYAQTELWRIEGVYKIAIRGDQGSIYLGYGSSEDNIVFPDTLTKVGTDGSIIWQLELPILKGAFFSGHGVYSISQNTEEIDSIIYCDTEGNVSWGYLMPYQVPNSYEVDGSGNLFALIHSSPALLIKLDTGGTKKFQVAIPQVSLTGIVDQEYFGPFIDQTGVVWVMTHAYVEIIKETESSYKYEKYRYIYAYRFNNTSGALISQKNILKKELIYMEKSSERGTTTIESGTDWNYIPIGNNLIGYGTYYRTLMQETERGGKEEHLTQWRILTIDQNLKSKLFKYKGKGLDKCKEEGYSYKSDEPGNILYDLARRSSNELYITGQIAKGTSNCGEPGLQFDGVLMNFGIIKKKPVWAKLFPNQSLGKFYVSPSQKVFVYQDEHTISTYDANGNPGSILTFHDIIDQENNYYRSNIRKVNTENGFIYLRMIDSETYEPYFAKYSIPSLSFSVGGEITRYEEGPENYTLFQNYPNPFNPITTIQFVLPEWSYVTIKIYNALGQEVATLLNHEEMQDGEQEIEFDASNLSSGVYIYKIIAEPISEKEEENASRKFIDIKRMLLVK